MKINFKPTAPAKSSARPKKTDFGSCNGCFGIFPVGNLIVAPPNKHNLRTVCQSCLNQYISPKKPVPSTAPPVLKNQFGAYLAKGGAGILSNANAGVVSTGGGGLTGNKSGGILSNANAGVIGQNGATMVAAGGMNLIGNDGSTMRAADKMKLVGNDGASLIGNDGSTFRRS